MISIPPTSLSNTGDIQARNQPEFESPRPYPKPVSSGIKPREVSDSLSLLIRDASRTKLLSRPEEYQLGLRIYRYRQAFVRLVLQEPDVVRHIISKIRKWHAGSFRLDSLCEVALNNAAARQYLEPRLTINLNTIEGVLSRLACTQSALDRRRLQHKLIRLFEEMSIRNRHFENSPFVNPKATDLLATYQRICQRMAQSNLRLVFAIARKICHTPNLLMDMIQEGNRGLMRAVTKFDYRRGLKFSTYATWWIRQSILAAIPNVTRNIRIPIHFHSQLRAATNDSDSLHPNGVDGSSNQVRRLAQQQGISTIDSRRFLAAYRDTKSLDQSARNANENVSLGDLIRDYRTKCPRRIAQQRERRQSVLQSLKVLNQRQREVVTLRFGLDDGVDRNQAEVGRELGICRERVRQIENAAFQKLSEEIRLT